MKQDYEINGRELPFSKGPYSYEHVDSRPDGKWRIRDSRDNAVGSAKNEEAAINAVGRLNAARSTVGQVRACGHLFGTTSWCIDCAEAESTNAR